MLIPLTQFYCDTCGGIIEKPEDGWIEWIHKHNEETGKYEIHSFNIVHHYPRSPYKETTEVGCYQHRGKPGRSDLPLHQFIDENYKMAHILSFLDIGSYHNENYKGVEITDMRQYVETVRRLTIPYYEEARLHWDEAKQDGVFDGANEIWIYGVGLLARIIERYGEK